MSNNLKTRAQTEFHRRRAQYQALEHQHSKMGVLVFLGYGAFGAALTLPGAIGAFFTLQWGAILPSLLWFAYWLFQAICAGYAVHLAGKKIREGTLSERSATRRLVIGGIFFFWFPLVLLLAVQAPDGDPVQRGTKLTTATNLQHRLYENEKQHLRESQRAKPLPAIQIAGIEIPSYLENLGFFFAGSPGSGKTQAISQMLHSLRDRRDFRCFILDRNGELLEKLCRDKDIIFNPSDMRSVSWSHRNEPSRAEVLAAALIPETPDEPFWGEAARSLLSDLYERTNAPYQVWDVLSSFSLAELREFCKGGLSARYLENDRTGSSVLSTLVNQSRFYRYLAQMDGEPFSFTRWAQSEDPRWCFLPLFEDDSELYKPLYSSAFELMIRGLLSNENRKIKTAIVVDELGALNQLRSLPRLLSESRKFNGTAILGTQTDAQIRQVYGDHVTSILMQGTATKLILNCRDPQSAEHFAKVIGQQERRDVVYGTSSNLTGFQMSSGSSSSEVIRETYAVLPSELQALPKLHGYLKPGDDVSPAKVQVAISQYPTVAPRLVPRQWQEPTPRSPHTSNGNSGTNGSTNLEQGFDR